MDLTYIDKMSEQGKFQEGYETLIKLDQENPNKPEILYRLGRMCFDLGQEKPISEGQFRKDQYIKGLQYANRALELDPNYAAAHKWIAILLGSLGDHVSTKEKIENSFKIKEHALKASEINPKDPTPYHILGKWCYGVASISWLERKAASALFATPPESTYEEAVEFFLKSDSIDPKFRRNSMALAETYYALRKWEDAKKWCKKVMDMPPVTEADKQIIQQATALLARC